MSIEKVNTKFFGNSTGWPPKANIVQNMKQNTKRLPCLLIQLELLFHSTNHHTQLERARVVSRSMKLHAVVSGIRIRTEPIVESASIDRSPLRPLPGLTLLVLACITSQSVNLAHDIKSRALLFEHNRSGT